MKAEETATGLQVLQDERHKRRVYAEFVKLFLGGDPWLRVDWDQDDVVTEIQTRKPELTAEQKRMGLRSRRFIDQPEWSDWD